MNQRLTRKDMKRDELVEALERSKGFVESHARALVLGTVAVVVLLLAGAGAWFWLAHRKAEAGVALAEAIEVAAAPVGAAAAAEPGEPSFPDAAARRARAGELFAAVREDYGMTAAADVAGLYLGQIAAEEGDLAEARARWEEFVAEHDDHLLADQTRVNLLHLDRQEGRGQQVVAELEAMLAAAPDERALPGDVVLYELAVGYGELGQAEQATATFRRLAEEYPTSPYAALAQQELGPETAAPLPTAVPGIG